MRTTINIDDQLLMYAKLQAAQQGCTLKEVRTPLRSRGVLTSKMFLAMCVTIFVTIQRIAKAKLSQALGVFHPLS
jgi:hypothetical protein